MESEPTYLYSSDIETAISNGDNAHTKNTVNRILSKFLNSGMEELPICLLSILLMMSGFLLFIYGLFVRHLYQFVMGFIFLISGLILDNARASDTNGKDKL